MYPTIIAGIYVNIEVLIESAYVFVSPERRSPNPQLLPLPEAAALLLALLSKPQEGTNMMISFCFKTALLTFGILG